MVSSVCSQSLGFALISSKVDQEDVIPSSQGEDTPMNDVLIPVRISRQMSFFRVETDGSDLEDPSEVVHWQEERIQDEQNGKDRTSFHFINEVPGVPLVLSSIPN